MRTLYDEVRSERHLFDVFALMILAGAGFAAFNLTKRVVEAQRRDIGIAMSLGVPRRKIAIRTMLLASEITVLGVALGVLFGWAIATWVLSVIRDSAPLPVWRTPFQAGLFVRAALLGLLVPLVASAFPVWRAGTGAPGRRAPAAPPPRRRSPAHARPAPLAAPGHASAVQAPVRRIVRAPARSLLTILAIAFIMAPLLAALGATDSASATISNGEQSPHRTDRRPAARRSRRLPVGVVERRSPHRAARRWSQRAEPALTPAAISSTARRRSASRSAWSISNSSLAAPASIVARMPKPGGIVDQREGRRGSPHPRRAD